MYGDGHNHKLSEGIKPQLPPPNNTVTMAHLVGHCVEAKEAVSLGYFSEELESIRNTILLCKGIEEAFDRKFLSFVPALRF